VRRRHPLIRLHFRLSLATELLRARDTNPPYPSGSVNDLAGGTAILIAYGSKHAPQRFRSTTTQRIHCEHTRRAKCGGENTERTLRIIQHFNKAQKLSSSLAGPYWTESIRKSFELFTRSRPLSAPRVVAINNSLNADATPQLQKVDLMADFLTMPPVDLTASSSLNFLRRKGDVGTLFFPRSMGLC